MNKVIERKEKECRQLKSYCLHLAALIREQQRCIFNITITGWCEEIIPIREEKIKELRKELHHYAVELKNSKIQLSKMKLS